MLTNLAVPARALLSISLLCAPIARAEVVSFQVEQPDLATSAGGTVTFTGTVTNESLVDLNASDFFFIFFGVDPTQVSLTQDFGLATDFLIPNGTTTPQLALFDATLAPSVPDGTTFSIQTLLETSIGNVSLPESVSLTASGTMVEVPEPGAFILVGTGLTALAGRRRKLRRP